MQITYNEDKKGYEVIVSQEEKQISEPLLKCYGFRWSENKKIFWAPENEQSHAFIQVISRIKNVEMNLPKEVALAQNIRNFFARNCFDFSDIAFFSAVSVEDVKLKVIEICDDKYLRGMRLYDKLIDKDVEAAVMSCMALFPNSEDNAIRYMLKEKGIIVSASCIAAIRKQNNNSGFEVKKQNEDSIQANKKGKEIPLHKADKKVPAGKDKKKEQEDMEAVSVDTVKKEYFEEHGKSTSIYVKEALKTGSFDVADIAKKAEVKEESVKCKIVEILSKEQLEQYGFLPKYLPEPEIEKKVMAYVKRQGDLPETYKLMSNIKKFLDIDISLSALKAVLKKNDVEENIPNVIYRPKGRAR